MNSLISLVEMYKFSLIGLSSIASFVYLTKKFYFNGGRCSSRARLDGRTAIITGANTGIGYETALDLSRRGARVILACRDMDKANQAAQSIRSLSGNGNVLVEHLDLVSLDSVRNFSQKVLAQEPRIDLLINNAGVMACPKWRTKDGYEMQFQVNHLSHFLLTNLLLDRIKQTENSRIVNVSSLAHRRGKINFDDMNNENSYEPQKVYAQSKLCNILFTRELARRLKDSNCNTTVNVLHPGVVRTELTRYFNESYGKMYTVVMFFIYPLFWWFSKSVRQGAQTTIYCAVSEELDNVSGEYLSDCRVKKPESQALSDQDAKRLWELSEKMCQLSN